MIRPPHLRPGDRLAALTASWGGPGAFPDRYEAGVRQLEDAFGVEVVELPGTRRPPDELAVDPASRAADLHAALTDPTIAGIVATIGGDDAIRVLPHVDLGLIRAHPKVLVGYSDTTLLHLAFQRAGVVSFYGPAIMAGFAENGGLHRYLAEGVRRTLFATEDVVWPENPDGWTVEFLDWADPANQQQARTLRPASGWRWLRGEAPVEGRTVVACLESLEFARGTAWWPDLDGAVLVLETSDEQPQPHALLRFVRVLEAMGELAGLRAIVLGRPGGADLDPLAHLDYDRALLQGLDEAGRDDLLVVAGVDIGHTDPMWTVPLGVSARLDPVSRRVVIGPGVG
jgi:muramoyltetrapeptide carboxypeptidase LdcA involved in peptidoglycan recycling